MIKEEEENENRNKEEELENNSTIFTDERSIKLISLGKATSPKSVDITQTFGLQDL